MLWPSRIDYAQAVGNHPHISILDPKFKRGNPRRGTNNYLVAYSGGFSIVFPVEVLSNIYALRCWIADIGDAETRYKEISDYLKQCRLPYFVDFEYVPNGIMVNGDKYPVTRMEWAEGETLCDFIKRNLQDARCLKTAAVEFQKMVAVLHDHQISHGDLQDGNILLKRSGTDVEIKLIDYDSVFVPALRGQPDTIVGVPAYQHPQRIAGGGRANEKVDYFSELVIYLSLLSLVEKPDLWHQFGAAEKRLLFKAEDFKNPDQSDVFRELENLSLDVKQLASKLKEFCKQSVDQLEPLESVLPKTSPAQVAYNQGLAYFRSNRYNEAVVEFEKAIGLDANYKEAHHGLGLAHLKMNDPGKARRAAEAALRIDPYYQPSLRLLEAIKSSSASPVSPTPTGASGRTSANPTPQTSPPVGASRPRSAQSVSQVLISQSFWQYITGALAFVLLICIVVLATQMGAKDKVLREIGLLKNQLVETRSQLDAATSSIRTLSNEKEQLFRENQKLHNQLIEQNMVTPTQIATVRRLRSEKEELRRRNQELRNQLTEQDNETKTQKAIVRQLRGEKEKLQNENATLREQLDKQHLPLDPLPRDDSRDHEQFRAASLQKIYHNSTPRVRLAAISKNNQGCTAFDRGQHSKAIALFQDAKESDLTSSVVRYNLGSTYLVMEEYIKARNYLQEAVILDPRFKEAYYNLALAYLGYGDRQEAKRKVQKSLSIDKNYRPARQLLDYLDRLMGDG